ncbi:MULTISPECIES: Wzz/FepE/Etk N-terminal domain-containing protein [Bacillaceae]|uniref:YveK family protein n=1 Tax=Bacillaceae TaxID=186817 RepID=UPI001BDE25B1|nr:MULTISPECIES: Wzz/FepE/Etk N-terminal domain-containing protein [Bacillaceae]MDX8361123.1 Wzz/FepE/Etk N-terminal domain-containing protein [Cytobacillus sp. IB215316]
MEAEIDFKQILYIVIKKIWIVIIMMIVAIVISGLISFYVLTPTYKSSAQILVSPTNSQVQPFSSNDIRLSLELINTYSEIIKSPFILEQVVEELELSYSPSSLNKLITIQTESQSQVFSIEVTNEDNELAAQITNTIVQVFKENIYELMNVNNVTILAEAKASSNPIKPNPNLIIALSVVASILVSLVLIFLIEFFDNSVKSEQDIDDLSMNILGTVNKIKKIKVKKDSTNIEVQLERGVNNLEN